MAKGMFKVEGAREVAAALQKFGDEFAEKAIVSEMWNASLEIRDAAQGLVPKDTGRLELFIGRVRVRSKDGLRATVKVGTLRLSKQHIKQGLTSDPYYDHFVEFGTENMPAQPFLRPAFDGKKESYTARLVDGLKKQVERAAKRAAAKTH